jgi:hypothetical protein
VRGATAARYEVCGGRVRRAGLRATLELWGDAGATLLSVGAHPGVVTKLWAHTRGAAPGPAPHVFALRGGPALAYQLSAAAAAAALPLHVHAAAAVAREHRTVTLAVRVMCTPESAQLATAVFEADVPAAASAPPLAMSPRGEWDAAARVVRWRLDGVPPSGRALLRARFPAAPGAFAAAPADAVVRVMCTLPFQVGDVSGAH